VEVAGGGGGPQKLPTEAELRLFKANQLSLNNATRKIAEMPKKDKEKLLQLAGRQGDMRGVFGDSSSKPAAGRAGIGPEPDAREQLPEEAGDDDLTKAELQDDLLGSKPGKNATGDKVHVVGSRMARSRQRLAINNDPGKVTQAHPGEYHRRHGRLD